MTPRDKAYELWSKMYQSPYVKGDDAKRCAMIAVDEILNTVIGNDWSSPIWPYWAEVKSEIEKL